MVIRGVGWTANLEKAFAVDRYYVKIFELAYIKDLLLFKEVSVIRKVTEEFTRITKREAEKVNLPYIGYVVCVGIVDKSNCNLLFPETIDMPDFVLHDWLLEKLQE